MKAKQNLKFVKGAKMTKYSSIKKAANETKELVAEIMQEEETKFRNETERSAHGKMIFKEIFRHKLSKL